MTTEADPAWTPAYTLDLDTATVRAFEDIRQKLNKSAEAKSFGPLPIQNGWYDVTPAMAEDYLSRNAHNRKVYFQTVKKYARAMRTGDWKATGQPLIFNKEGKAADLQHRCWASYLGLVSFPSYIITDAPNDDDLFAYIDDCKARNAIDALQTSGMDGLAAALSGAIKLAWRYDNNMLTIDKLPRFDDLSIREVLSYAADHIDLEDAAHMLFGTHPESVSIIGHKGVAAFFTWKALDADVERAESFLVQLGHNYDLPDDSPIAGLRRRLLAEADCGKPMPTHRRLALCIKAFNYYRNDKTLTKSGLFLRDNEKFPRFDEPVLTSKAA